MPAARIVRRGVYWRRQAIQEWLDRQPIESTATRLLEVQGRESKKPSGGSIPNGFSDLSREALTRDGFAGSNDPSQPRTVTDDCASRVR
jgi:hypothetical protein